MKRMAQAVLFLALLAALALGLPGEAQAYTWRTVTVDPDGNVGRFTSLAVDASGDPIISYHNASDTALNFATCQLSATSCDKTTDWSTVTVDGDGDVGRFTSIAVDAEEQAMISYFDSTNWDLKFAICDMSTTGCDETTDWSTVTVDSTGLVGQYTSIAVDPNGDPVISYFDSTNWDLKFAICDMATGCDEQTDWGTVTVDSAGNVGQHTSIAVDANGDPVISYWDESNDDLRFAICDMATGCDEQTDWGTVTVDSAGNVGKASSIAVDPNGDPMISYFDLTNTDLKFAMCDLSATNCDQQGHWSSETVDMQGAVGPWPSIVVDASGHPMTSYWDGANQDLKFAIGSPPSPPVGGIAELPDVSDSSALSHIALAGLAAAALLALGTGAWYASTRRWLT